MTAARALPKNYGDFLPASSKSPTVSADDPTTVYDWAALHRRIDGQAFALERYEPLRALYRDNHPHICVIKPAQRGVSEYAVNLAIFALEHGAQAWGTGKNGLNVGYLFPTQQALGDFSKERVSNLRAESPHLNRLFASSDFGAVTFKQVGNSFLYLRGASSESQLLSFAADVLILDEYDRMDPKAVALARRRLNASVVRREVDISTPTIPGRAIHALYAQSDRHVYEQACPYCGDFVRLDFLRDVRVDGVDHGTWREWEPVRLRQSAVALHCPACRHPWQDADRLSPGRWVATEPAITSLRGYHVPTLPFPMTDLERLVVAAVATDPGEITEFWRSDLGLPFDASGSRVTAAMLAQLAADLPGGLLPQAGPWRDTTMGIDVGGRFHYRISSFHPGRGRRVVRAMGSVSSWDDLTHLMTRYQVRRCVIDALPELHACQEWARKFRGRVLRAFYTTGRAEGKQLLKPDDERGIVQINRTMALDAVYSQIAGAEEDWPAAIAHEREVVAHLTAPVRVVVRGDDGQDRPSWEHTTPDHLFHACAYDHAAQETLSMYRKEHRMPIFAQGVARGW